MGLPAAWLVLALLLAAHAALSLDGVAAPEPALAVRLGAAGLCLWRAARDARERWAWAALAAALSLWTLGDATGSDFAGLAGYPAAWTALVLLIRARVRGASRLSLNLWLDGAIAAVAVAAAAVAVVVGPLADLNGSGTGAVATGLAYPLGDLMLLGLAVGAPSLTFWRPGPSLTFIALGLSRLRGRRHDPVCSRARPRRERSTHSGRSGPCSSRPPRGSSRPGRSRAGCSAAPGPANAATSPSRRWRPPSPS